MKIELKNNAIKVMNTLNGNVNAALQAMGVEAVGMIVDQMQEGYGAPIRQTGDLMRDVNYEVERSGPNTVDVGNSLFYGPFVHEGTRKMAGRPYIKDALTSPTNVETLQDVAAQELRKGFE